MHSPIADFGTHLRTNRRPSRQAVTPALCLALFAVSCAMPAHAASTVALSGRSSTNYFYYFGGFAIASDEGEDGAPAPVAGGAFEGTPLTALAPRTLAIAGSDHADLHYLFWDGFLDETWSQAQSYDFGNDPQGAMLQGDGAASITQVSNVCGLGNCGPATELHRSINTQTIDFLLSGPTPYRMTGSTSGGQWVDLLRWDETHNLWTAVVFGAVATRNVDFDLSGDLAGGLYRVANNLNTFSGGGPTDVNNAWSYSLLLSSATAVPLPNSGGLLLAGVGLLAARRRARMGI